MFLCCVGVKMLVGRAIQHERNLNLPRFAKFQKLFDSRCGADDRSRIECEEHPAIGNRNLCYTSETSGSHGDCIPKTKE
jgi:hypothetical protein